MAPASLPILLRAARDAIRDPEAWCQGQMEDDDGRRRAMGALAAALHGVRAAGVTTYKHPAISEAIGALNEAAKAVNPAGGNIVWLNDNGTHEDVMLAFKHAIAACEEP